MEERLDNPAHTRKRCVVVVKGGRVLVAVDLSPPHIVTMLRVGNTEDADVASTNKLTAPIELPTKCADSIPIFHRIVRCV